MADNLSQYLPAVKVGGRRLSTSIRQKPHLNTETAQHENKHSPDETPSPVSDYPRPNPQDQNHDAPPHRQQREEEIPKKDRQEKKVQELHQRKMEQNIPTRDGNASGKGNASGTRISQPAGKAFGI